MYDAVECCKMSFEGILGHVERVLYVVWTIYPPCLRKRLRGLKNGFCDF